MMTTSQAPRASVARDNGRVGTTRVSRAARLSRLSHAAGALALLCAAAVLAGCGTAHPGPIGAVELSEAQSFPYFKTYWVGPSFAGQPLVAADGQSDYISSVGDSVYYGDCVPGKHIVGGSCLLPLQITTVIYALHSNASFGAQHNTLVRGVPATIYDEGRSLELYSGRVAIDIFSDTLNNALRAANELRPLNAPGSAAQALPLPVYCPGMSGALTARLRSVMEHLPGQACQRTSAQLAVIKSISQ
jgi:hypothetical protein